MQQQDREKTSFKEVKTTLSNANLQDSYYCEQDSSYFVRYFFEMALDHTVSLIYSKL